MGVFRVGVWGKGREEGEGRGEREEGALKEGLQLVMCLLTVQFYFINSLAAAPDGRLICLKTDLMGGDGLMG